MKSACSVSSISPAEYFDYVDRMTAFESFGVYTPLTLSLTGDGEPERLSAAAMTAAVFQTLNVVPAAGRVFSTAEDVPGVHVAVGRSRTSTAVTGPS